MKFNIKETSGISVIKMEGSLLGGPEVSELNNTLHKFVDAKKKKVIVDLSDVSLMNSSGLGMLIASATTMRNAGGDLKLACASAKILKLLEVTKLLTVFEHYKNVKEAIQSF
jgi:anti-sigma B factor antagonist